MPAPEFDVFLSHAASDKPTVKEVARLLVDRYGIKPWLDEWNLVPGEPWQEAIEKALGRCAACAVFFGPGATGPWQNEEMRAAIERQAGEGGYPVIPVLLPKAERGERSRLPTFLTRRTWVEFQGTIEDEKALRRLIAGIRGLPPGRDPEDEAPAAKPPKETADVGPAVEIASPYRGLQFFDVGDCAFFHGREALIGWLLAKLQPTRLDQRFLAITGPSGSGKSSLARAGLLAALKDGELPGSKDWPIAICKPGPQPLESLALALAEALPLGSSASSTLGLMRDLANDHRMLHLTSRFALRRTPSDRRLVVLVDQFEEVFTLCADESQRQALIGNLLYASKEPDGQTAVVLTLRSDFYGRCAADSELASAVSDRGELVGPMTEDELRSAIEEPARTEGLHLEGGLTDLLAGEVLGQTGGLPLLEHALLQLWQRRDGLQLTVATYREIGGVTGALQRHAEEVFQSFTPPEKEACRRILLRLVQVDEQGRATKRRLDRDELIPAAGLEADRKAAEAVVSRLSNERLLTTEATGTEKRPTVELAHEALLRAWKDLSEWIDADREALRLRRRLDEAASEWIASGRDPSFLYSGARLAQAEEWVGKHPGESSGSAREFLAASAAQRDQELKKRQRQRQRWMIALAAATVVTTLVAATMYRNWKVTAQKLQTLLATQMVGRARLTLPLNPLVSLLLATQAAHLDSDLPAAKDALLEALALSEGQPLGKTGIVAITASVDRRTLVTASRDGTVTLWSLQPGPPKTTEHSLHVAGTVAALVLSNDRRWLLVRDRNDQVRLLDLRQGDQGIPLPREDWRYGNPFSPNSLQLMTDRVGTPVLRDLVRQTARDMPAGSSPNPWNGLDVNANALKLAPQGATIATLSSDGQWLAWGEKSGVVRFRALAFLQTLAFPNLPAIELPGQGQPVGFLMFAAGDRWLITQGGSEAPRLWDLQRYPQGKVLAATPDGRRAVGMPNADAVRVERPGGTVALEGVQYYKAIWAFSPEGSRLAAVRRGVDLQLWNLGNGDRNPKIIPWPPVSVEVPQTSPEIASLAFSPEGDRLAFGSSEGGAWLWDPSNNDPLLLSQDPENQRVTALAFSSRPRLATGWQNGAVRIFRLDDLTLLNAPDSRQTAVNALAFSPDGEWLAIAYADDKAILWKEGWPEKSLENQDPKINVLAFSPDGRWLAGAGQEGLIQLWDRDNRSGVPVAWQSHDGRIHSLSFAKGSKELITTGQSVRRWPLEVDEMIRLACEKAGPGRNLTKEEWTRHALPGEPFREGTPCDEKKSGSSRP